MEDGLANLKLLHVCSRNEKTSEYILGNDSQICHLLRQGVTSGRMGQVRMDTVVVKKSELRVFNVYTDKET